MSRPTVRLRPAEILRLGLLGPRTRRLRAVLSSLGIAIGVATMIVVVGIPASGNQALNERLSGLGTNLLSAKAVADEQTDELPPVPESAQDMAARVPPVERVSEVANTHATVRRSEAIPEEQGSGLTALAVKGNNLPALIDAEMQSGHYLDKADRSFPTVVLGSVAATRLGVTNIEPDEPAPEVRIGAQNFTVVGILKPTPLEHDVERSVLVGWHAAEQWLDFDRHPTVLYARAQESQVHEVAGVLGATMFPKNPGKIQVSRPSEALKAKKLTESTFSGLFLGLAGVALLVGAVGVANTMVVSVLERRREIGLRRALGATRGQIRSQFVAESVLLCLLGGVSGAVAGALGTVAYAMVRGWPAVIPAGSVLGGIGAALVVGVLAGVQPAMRASRLSPTEALATA